MSKFTYMDDRQRVQIKCNPKDAVLEQAGKKIYVDEFIQEQNKNCDCEIYPTLEKYGCLKEEELDKTALNLELQDNLTLQDIYQQQINAEKMWLALPLSERALFNNSPREFALKAPAHYAKIEAERIAKEQKEAAEEAAAAAAAAAATTNNKE